MANTTNPQALPSNPTIPSGQLTPTVFNFDVSGPRDVWPLNGSRGFLSLDVAISVTHSSEVQVTEHPVEQGQDVTDNARPKPDTLTIEGFISGTPIGPTFGWYDHNPNVNDKGYQFPIDPLEPGVGRAKQAFDLLRDLKNKATIINVTTDLNNYPNMVIESLTIPQDSMTGDSLRFTVKLRSILMVNSQGVIPVVTVTSASGKTKKGAKVPADATKADENKTNALVAAQKIEKFISGSNTGILQ